MIIIIYNLYNKDYKMKKLLMIISLFILSFVNTYADTDFQNCKLADASCNVTKTDISYENKQKIDKTLTKFYYNTYKKYNSLYDTQYLLNVMTNKLKDIASKWNIYEERAKLIYYIYENVEQEYYKVWYYINISVINKNDWTNNLQDFKNSINWNNENKPEKNTYNKSFYKSKKILENYVYNDKLLDRNTFYCWCSYNSDKKLIWDCDYENEWKENVRDNKIEWEHVVASEHIWQHFKSWTIWMAKCKDNKWDYYKWRKCAEKDDKFAYIYADMYNLFPAVWSLNMYRSNHVMWEIVWEERNFWKCDVELEKNVNNKYIFEPNENNKWDIARTYRYIEETYDINVISDKNEKLFNVWEKIDPISKEECRRYYAIKKYQWNKNIVLHDTCEKLKKDL